MVMERKEDWEAKLNGKIIIPKDNNSSDATANDGKYVLETSLPRGTRVLSPDSCYTCDYIEDRLNVFVDETNMVTKVELF